MVRLERLLRSAIMAAPTPPTRSGFDAVALQRGVDVPLDAVQRAELRAAAVALLAVLDGDATPLTRPGGRTIDDVIADVQAVDVARLSAGERMGLAEAVAPLCDGLRGCGDIDVTRILLDGTTPGPMLADLIFDTDPDVLDPDSQVSYVQACQRLANAVSARQDGGIVAFAGANPRNTAYFVDGDVHALVDARALELQLALAWSEGFTRSRIEQARTLRTLLPQCHSVIAAGTVQPVVARAITDGAHTLTASIDEAIRDAVRTRALPEHLEALRQTRRDLLHAYDTGLSAYAPEHSLRQVGEKIRRTIQRLDPAGVLARRARAIRTQTDVTVSLLADGMALLTAVMPAEQAIACHRVLDAHAHNRALHDGSDPIGLRRTRALFQLLTRSTPADATGHGQGDARTGLPVHLDIVMTLDAFCGLTDEPAEMPGAGTIPAHTARDLLADAAWIRIRRILTHPRTGHALDVGVPRYRLTPAEADRIALRDRTCRMIDCTTPAHRCECDHATPYNTGGTTRTANLGLACKKHHQHKTHAGWTITESTDDGSCTWTSPLGRTYTHQAKPVLPSAAPDPPPY
jgi:hypothetical protein